MFIAPYPDVNHGTERRKKNRRTIVIVRWSCRLQGKKGKKQAEKDRKDMANRKKNRGHVSTRKVDTAVNGDILDRLVELRLDTAKLHPLRIDHRTVIYVTSDKLTEEYAVKYKQKIHCNR